MADYLVNAGDSAFRVRVVKRLWRAASLCFEHLTWPARSVRAACTLPYPGGGFGGAVLSISPGQRHAAALMYSGQGDIWSELFVLTPQLKHIGGLEEIHADSDLTPVAFSPDDELAAIAASEPLWWIDPDEDDPDWDTPAVGGVVEWGTVYLHRLCDATLVTHSLRVDLPRGWRPPGEESAPAGLRFRDDSTLAVLLPWGGAFAFEIPPSQAHVLVDPPRRKRRRDR